MLRNIQQKVDIYVNRHRLSRIWRKIAGVLACVVVVCTIYALVLPAITMEKTDPEEPEYTYTGDYSATEGVDPSDTDASSPSSMNTAEQPPQENSGGTDDLTYGEEGRVPTDESTVPELSDAEQAQVAEVIAMIDALPDKQDIDAALSTLGESEEDLIAYLTELVAPIESAWDAFLSLTDTQQTVVTNAEKLIALGRPKSVEKLPVEKPPVADDEYTYYIRGMADGMEGQTNVTSDYEIGFKLITAPTRASIFAMGKNRTDLYYKSVPWSGGWNDNYQLAYCADMDRKLREDSFTEIPLHQTSTFTNHQKQKLQFIIERSYPFVSETEMVRLINTASGADINYTKEELITAVQSAIWNVTNNQPYSETTDDASSVRTVASGGNIVPVSVPNADSDEKIRTAMNYLLSGVSDPAASGMAAGSLDIETHDSHVTENSDGSYQVEITLTLSRAVVADEGITATVTGGAEEQSFPVFTDENKRVVLTVNHVPITASLLHVRLNGIPSGQMKVYYYEPSQKITQPTIGGRVVSGTGSAETDVPLSPKTTEVSVVKAWVGLPDDDTHPTHVQVTLLQNGIPYGEPETLDAANQWKHTWTQLPLRDRTGNAYTYTVQEDIPSGYYCTSSNDGNNHWTITNTKIKTISVSVEKHWSGLLPEDGSHPVSIKVHLRANDHRWGDWVTLSEENHWFYRWDALPQQDVDGNEIHYSVEEKLIPEYETEIVQDNSGGNTVPVQVWEPASMLEHGETYLLVYNGQAITAAPDSGLLGAAVNLSDVNGTEAMRWIVSSYDDGFVLHNALYGKNLTFCYGATIGTGIVEQYGGISDVVHYDGTLWSSQKPSYYFAGFENGYGKSSTKKDNAGQVTLYRLVEKSGQNPDLGDIHYVITNIYTGMPPDYELPNTGGGGRMPYVMAGLALVFCTGISLLYRIGHRERLTMKDRPLK